MPSAPRRLVRRIVPHELRVRGRRLIAGVPGVGAERGVDGDGAPRPRSAVRRVRKLLDRKDMQGALELALSLAADPDTAEVGRLCLGVVAHRRGYPELAWHELRDTPTRLWPRFAPEEYVASGLVVDPARTLGDVRDLLATDPALPPRVWQAILDPVYGAGEHELARALLGRVDRAIGPDTATPALLRRDWMHRWIERTETSPSREARESVRFAILDYDHPTRGRSSANIGDHVQTVASLGHLARRDDVTLTGPADVVGFIDELRGRVRPDRRVGRTADPVRVEVVVADRDATRYNPIPENSWTLAFGWYMHALFGVRFGFPFHPNLQPIFISFHCNKRDLLTPEAIDYLREHGPIGCRDWTTVDTLLSVDVPAFFSGCMTTTIDTVYKDLPHPPSSDLPVAYVDSPVDDGVEGVVYGHSSDDVRKRTFIENLRVALHRLETYRTEHSSVVTSRLHCWLPSRSIGARVEFRPENPSDIRFAGLWGTDDAAFDAIRTGINDKLEQVLGEVFAGAEPAQVYARWAELTADEVEVARVRHHAALDLPPVSDAARTLVADAVAGTRTWPAPDGAPASAPPSDSGTVHLAVALSEVGEPIEVLVSSVLRHTQRPLHVWLLSRARADLDLGPLAERFPHTTFTAVPAHALTEGLGLGEASLFSVAPRLELVSLPDLLPGVDRVLVLPLHALVSADVGQLWDLDLSGELFAAPDALGTRSVSGFGVVHRAADRLRERTELSTELRRHAHSRHVFDFAAFDSDVLVADLAAMRQAAFVEQATALSETFGLSARELMHVVSGPHHASVPPRWHVVPTRSSLPAALLHWADRGKPWDEGAHVPGADDWAAERERVRGG